MDDAKEKPTGVVAYLAYVRILWVVSDKVRRQIARFLYFYEDIVILKRIIHTLSYKGGHVFKIDFLGDEAVKLDDFVGKKVDCGAHFTISVTDTLHGQLL